MPLVAKDGGGGGFEQVSEGVHRAVCYSIYDLGTHRDDRYQKDVHKVLMIWELPDERVDVDRDGEKKNLPRVISKKYTLSLGEKAILRKDLETWRGRAFTAEELKGFDLQNVLGKGCQLQVIHKMSEGKGKKYANIMAIIPLPKGSPKLTPENPVRWFSFAENKPIPDGTPDWIKDEIHKSEEWLSMTGQPGMTAGDEPPLDDDIPF